ncbi:hypothetical protein MHU86_20975 [Fragilaria crotonensis]|nr:hypothetical protein MHU86_20975 [Fragilaria crotonensis]
MMTKNILCKLFLFLGILNLTTSNCDVYKQTMDAIDYWHSYDWSQGMGPAIDQLYADDAKVTSSTSSGTVTASPREFFGAFSIDIAKLKIDVRDIDCAADGGWCHLRVIATYWSQSEETISIPQYWTYFYDPVTCKWAHYVILQHSNDLEYMVDVLTPVLADEEQEADGEL